MRFVRILSIAVLVACANEITAPRDTDFTLGVGETVSIRGTDLSVKFVRTVEDSRCPLGVLCIWAGNAQIELVAHSGRQNTTFTLNTTDGAKEFVVRSYRIALLELNPVPTSAGPIPPGAYRAKLKVTAPGIACTEGARPALVVALTDSLSGSAVSTFTGVVVVARDGAYADSVVQATYPGAPFNGPVALAYERAGIYTVTVRANGYSPWTRAGIVVTSDQCHVATVTITARLAH